MMQAEAVISSWGTSLGIRIPKEFIKHLGIDHKSRVQLEMRDGALQITPIRKRKPLAEIIAEARQNGSCDGMPYELTQEDREWLESPLVGAEVVDYD